MRRAIVIAFAALAVGGACSKDEPVHGLQLVYEVEGDADDARHALDVIRRRVDALDVDEPNIYLKDGLLYVELPGEGHERARRLLGKQSRLELVVAVHEHRYMKELARAADSDERAPRAGVEVASDLLSLEQGTTRDLYLRGPTRVVLASYVEELTARTSRPVPDGHRFLFERVAPDTPDQEPYWRTHFVLEGAALDGTAIAGAELTTDPYRNDPRVMLTLDDEAAEAFEALTREHVGDRLVVVVNGAVVVAPVVTEPIPGGRVQITLGGDFDRSPDERRREAQDLVLLLRAGSLRAPLRLVAERTF